MTQGRYMKRRYAFADLPVLLSLSSSSWPWDLYIISLFNLAITDCLAHSFTYTHFSISTPFPPFF